MGYVLSFDILYEINVDLRIGGQTRTSRSVTVIVRWVDGRNAQGFAYAPPIFSSLCRRRIARVGDLTRPIPRKRGTDAPAGRVDARSCVW